MNELLGKYGGLPHEGVDRNKVWEMIEEMPEEYFRAIEHIVKDYHKKYKDDEEQ